MEHLGSLASPISKAFESALSRLLFSRDQDLEVPQFASIEGNPKSSLRRALRQATVAASTADVELARVFATSPVAADIVMECLLAELERKGPAENTRKVDRLRLYLKWLGVSSGAATPIAEAIAKSVRDAAASVARSTRCRDALATSHLNEDFRSASHQALQLSAPARTRNLKAFSSHHTLQAVEDVRMAYACQLQNAFKRITPANFGTARPVAFNSVYVPASIAHQESPVKLGDFLAKFQRVVVLGDPGGGKTTLTRKILLDSLSAGGLFGRKGLTPFVITLREFAAKKADGSITLLEFLYETIPSLTQIQLESVPSKVVEHLLETGQALLIFDGLDELLETSRRREIVRNVEQFCALYPNAAAIVTSRRVGYGEAPLDDSAFGVFHLNSFGPDEIRLYAERWFTHAPDIDPARRPGMTDDFLQASMAAADLLANPLMLSLMCNLYKGENYIPKNRPELYEKCATMLFERWDKERDIIVKLGFKDHVRPAMMALAARIYETPELSDGIAEADLKVLTSEYLLRSKYDSEEKAENAAEEFVTFCTGRAWVFSNVGANGDEELFQFTHRTFLEYFTAAHLVRTLKDPDALLAVLAPHLREAGWDVVAQLACQMIARAAEGGADRLLSGLTALIEAADTGQSITNLCDFSIRALQFLEPREPTVRALIRTVALNGMTATRAGFDSHEIEFRERLHSPLELLLAFKTTMVENQDAVIEGIAELATQDGVAGGLVLPHLQREASANDVDDADPWVARLGAAVLALHRSVNPRYQVPPTDLYMWREESMAATEARFAQRTPNFPRDIFIPGHNYATLTRTAPDTYQLVSQTSKKSQAYWVRWSEDLLKRLRNSAAPFFDYCELIGEHLFMANREARLEATSPPVLSCARAIVNIAAVEALAIASVDADEGTLGQWPEGKLASLRAASSGPRTDHLEFTFSALLESDPLRDVLGVDPEIGQLCAQSIAASQGILSS